MIVYVAIVHSPVSVCCFDEMNEWKTLRFIECNNAHYFGNHLVFSLEINCNTFSYREVEFNSMPLNHFKKIFLKLYPYDPLKH